MGTLGIIAGGGELPLAIAESARAKGRDVFVMGIESMAERGDFAGYASEWAGIGQLGKTLDALKKAGCDRVTFAGRVSRPDFAALKLDLRGMGAVARVAAAALRGDDAILRTMLDIFEKEGFAVVGTADAAPDLIAQAGVYGRHKPGEQALNDIAIARQVIERLGELDIGQATAVADGLVLAVEAAEGTDAMLKRIPELGTNLRGTAKKRRGVLLKAPKPKQDRRVDLPVIGVRTVELAAEGGLAGIAVQAGAALLMRKEMIVETADRLGLFVMGFEASP